MILAGGRAGRAEGIRPCARRNFALRSFASAAFRSPSICTASPRKSSSWCAPRARCMRLRTAPGGQKRRSSTASIATTRNMTPRTFFELLRDIGGNVEMRVVVDIIAGASAGGINGTMLARALSHDLPMGALRDLWLKNADVAVLLAPDARAGAWSKWFLK